MAMEALEIRREVMHMAWGLVRDFMWREYELVQDWTPGPAYGRQRQTTATEKRAVFAEALRRSWSNVKQAEEQRARRAAEATRPAAELDAEIIRLENRTFLGQDGIARLAALRRAHAAALTREAEEAKAADLAHKRALIASAKGRICAVTFTKKDGAQRVMKIQPATLKFHVKGDAATESGKKAAATRAAHHPHLLPVWDAEAKAPRSVNLETVSRIAVDGQIHLFDA